MMPTSRSGSGGRDDRRVRGLIHLHAGGDRRPRDHLAGAGDPAHAADVGQQLHSRYRADRCDGVLGHADTTLEKAIGFIAVLMGAGNAAGGYVVTERMLDMFKSSRTPGPKA